MLDRSLILESKIIFKEAEEQPFWCLPTLLTATSSVHSCCLDLTFYIQLLHSAVLDFYQDEVDSNSASGEVAATLWRCYGFADQQRAAKHFERNSPADERGEETARRNI